MKHIINQFTGEKARKATLIILVMIYFLRIINLDQDLPPWGIATYQPADEGAYAMLAINKQNYGVINPISPESTGMKYGSYTPPSLRTNILGNLFTYIGLSLIGDNYFGLRVPYILFGFINLMLFLIVLNILRKKYGTGRNVEKWLVVGALFCMVTDFSFYIASRTVEPSLVRMIFSQLIFIALLKFPDSYRLRFFLIGILISISVFLIYITNVFLFLAMALTLLHILRTKGRDKFFSSTGYFILGCTLIYVLSEMYFHFVWHTSALINMYYSITDFAGVQGYNITGVTGAITLKIILKGLIKYFSANYFLYNTPILTLFAISVPIVIYAIVKKKDINVFFLFGAVLSFLLQTMVSEDYIARKLLLIYPYFIFLIFLAYYNRKEFLNKIKKRRNLIMLYLFLTGVFCISSVFFRLFIIRDGTVLDFSTIDKLLIIILGLVPTLFFIIKTIYGTYKDELNYRKLMCVCLTMFSMAVVLNITLITKYTIIRHNFSERNAMIELADKVNDKYVVGNYQIGFTLYNTMKPIYENYNVYAKIMEKNNDVLYLDYDDKIPGMRNFLDNTVFMDSQYTAEPIYEVKRTFQTFGQAKNMSLYKVALKKDVIKAYRDDYMQKERAYNQEKDQLFKTLEGLNYDEYRLEKARIENELAKDKEALGTNPYPDSYGDTYGDLVKESYVTIHGNIYGNIEAPIYGDVYGNIYGNVEKEIKGHVYGTIYGKILINSEEPGD